MTDAPQLLTDIRLALRHAELRPVYDVGTDRRRVTVGEEGPRLLNDIATVTGRSNLAQAIVLRLLTPRGELSALGHPGYGSRLHELIGRRNGEGTRHLVKLHILEALQLEPRVARVVEVTTAPHVEQRTRIDVRLSVIPIGDTEVLDVGPFTIELQ